MKQFYWIKKSLLRFKQNKSEDWANNNSNFNFEITKWQIARLVKIFRRAKFSLLFTVFLCTAAWVFFYLFSFCLGRVQQQHAAPKVTCFGTAHSKCAVARSASQMNNFHGLVHFDESLFQFHFAEFFRNRISSIAFYPHDILWYCICWMNTKHFFMLMH